VSSPNRRLGPSGRSTSIALMAKTHGFGYPTVNRSQNIDSCQSDGSGFDHPLVNCSPKTDSNKSSGRGETGNVKSGTILEILLWRNCVEAGVEGSSCYGEILLNWKYKIIVSGI